MKRILTLLIIVGALFLWAEDVTFNVNMNYQISLGNFDPAIDSVDVAGNFNGWGDSPIIGEDLDGDGIYSMTVTDLEVGFECEYKFRINSNWGTSEFPGGGANRFYTVVTGENIVDHWYNDEEMPSVFADVVFTVTDGTENYLDIKFKSSFNDWELYQMTDDGVAPDEVAGDHVWTVLVEDIPNGTHTWGALEDDGSQSGYWLIDGPDLEYTIDDQGNVSGQTDYVIDPGSVQDVTVTFQVDMNLVPTVGVVTIAGSFNSWTVPGEIMTDDDMDGIYTIDILLPSGSLINEQYKYLNDAVYEDIENRSFVLDDSVTEQILPVDYFNNMNSDDYNDVITPDQSELVNYPNPFNPETVIAYQIPVQKEGVLSIYNFKGQLVKTYTGIAGTGSIVWDGKNESDENVASGLYFAKVKAGDWEQTRKMLLLK
ncbi:MAG: T9SS type A sorting domain-containing protein [Candidatus Stygibacter frigidus]|nr:T9SS type A sorting domain-containing protein [Candidatus Stygibacter frigidus]